MITPHAVALISDGYSSEMYVKKVWWIIASVPLNRTAPTTDLVTRIVWSCPP